MPSFPCNCGIYSYNLDVPKQFVQQTADNKTTIPSSICQFVLLFIWILVLYVIFRLLTDLDKLLFLISGILEIDDNNNDLSPYTILIKLISQFIRSFYASIVSLSFCIILKYVLYNHSNPIIGYLNTIKKISIHYIIILFIIILIFSFIPHLLLFVFVKSHLFHDNIYLFFHDNFLILVIFPFLFISIYYFYVKYKEKSILERTSSNLQLTLLERNSIMQFTIFTAHRPSNTYNQSDKYRKSIQEINESVDQVIDHHINPFLACFIYLINFMIHRFIFCILKDIKYHVITTNVISYYFVILLFYWVSKLSLKKSARKCDEIIIIKYHEYIKKLLKCKQEKNSIIDVAEFNVPSLEYLMECYLANVYYVFYRKIIFLYIDNINDLSILFFTNFVMIEMFESIIPSIKFMYNYFKIKFNVNCDYHQWLFRIFMDIIYRFYACSFSGIFMLLLIYFNIQEIHNYALYKYLLLLISLEIISYVIIIIYLLLFQDNNWSGISIFIQYTQRHSCYIITFIAFMMISIVL